MNPFMVQAPPDPTKPADDQAPAKLHHTDTARITKACHHVTHLYPGAAGKILAQYLLDYSQWGYRVSQTALPAQLVDEVLAQLPEQR
jgi:hypothetical protein